MLDSYKELIAAKAEIKMLKKQLKNSKPIVLAHWIKTMYGEAECSNCKEVGPDCYELALEFDKYCPNCGAQMDEVAECSK